MELFTQQTHLYKIWLRSFASVDSPWIFLTINPCRPCSIIWDNFSKSVQFTTRFISETKTVTPNFFCISGTSNLLSACSKNLKKFYRLENFRANVLKFSMEIENNGMLPFLGTKLINKSSTNPNQSIRQTYQPWPFAALQEPCWRLLQARLIKDYAWSCLPPLIQLVILFRWMRSAQNGVFSSQLHRQVNYSTISRFIAVKASDQPVLELPALNHELKAVPVVLLFKDQSAADIVRAQLKDISQKIQVTVLPISVSHKIKQHLKPHEVMPPIVNQQSLVYQFKCGLCDAGYVGYTRRHLHQRVYEHKNASSSIRKHFRLEHSYACA